MRVRPFSPKVLNGIDLGRSAPARMVHPNMIRLRRGDLAVLPRCDPRERAERTVEMWLVAVTGIDGKIDQRLLALCRKQLHGLLKANHLPVRLRRQPHGPSEQGDEVSMAISTVGNDLLNGVACHQTIKGMGDGGRQSAHHGQAMDQKRFKQRQSSLGPVYREELLVGQKCRTPPEIKERGVPFRSFVCARAQERRRSSQTFCARSRLADTASSHKCGSSVLAERVSS